VKPVFPPSAPLYRVSSIFSFWIWNPLAFGWAGIWVRIVVSYLRKSGSAKQARAMSARSYALVNWPRPSSPDGVTACVSNAPSRRASAFIAATPPFTPPGPPPRRASTFAASLPDWSSRPIQSVATEYFPPSTNPTAELPGSKSRSPLVTVITCLGSSLGSTVAASSSFCTLAGVPYSCGPQAPRTSPLSMSATSQEVAVSLPPGTAGTPGDTARPVVANPSPPTVDC
jgi:hypothetical protein